MTSAELYLHYHEHPLPPKPRLVPEVTTETTVVLPFHEWMKNRCQSCKKRGCSGIWLASFSDGTQFAIKLCANCGLNSRCIKKACGMDKLYPGGWGAPKFEQLDLLVTLTYPSRELDKA